MRFIITAAPDPSRPQSEPQAPPDEKVLAAYMRFNEDMHNAGVLLASEGLNPAGQGARIGISGGKRVVRDGPYAETKELVGGFYLIQVGSRQEAIDWALRCPIGLESADVLTIHQMTEASDIPPEMMKIILDEAPSWSATFTKAR